MKRSSKKLRHGFGQFILSLVICQGAGLLGSVVTVGAINGWYAVLVKPSFNPPNWIFGPVWTILFFLMGISLYVALGKRLDLYWFKVQLILNVLWSILFFGIHSPILAFVDIVFLWWAIYKTIQGFWKNSKGAAALLLPYLTWVSFAAVLNFFIWRLN